VPPVLIGYMAKRTARAGPEHKLPSHVREIASVSACISQDPPDWIERWIHNDLGFFDSLELALSVVPEAERGLYEVYAYKMLPRRFDGPIEKDWPLPELRVQPMPADFRRLGYDVVGHPYDFFDCSPLSCNAIAAERPVNAYCLFEREEEALDFLRSEQIWLCEPGPHALLEVWRARP
jgi:hypothetical protein